MSLDRHALSILHGVAPLKMPSTIENQPSPYGVDDGDALPCKPQQLKSQEIPLVIPTSTNACIYTQYRSIDTKTLNSRVG